MIATGGLSIPKIGATDFAYRLAKQFGHKLIDMRPALVPLTFAADDWAPFAALSGLSLEVQLSTGKGKTRGEFSKICCSPIAACPARACCRFRATGSRRSRFTSICCRASTPPGELLAAKTGTKKQIANLSLGMGAGAARACLARNAPIRRRCPPCRSAGQDAAALGEALSRWTLTPNGTEGYRKAEVTRGGVDTRDLSSTTMMSARVPGLYFIGEAVDVTGWLGGYNFQWAWASGVAAGQAAADMSGLDAKACEKALLYSEPLQSSVIEKCRHPRKRQRALKSHAPFKRTRAVAVYPGRDFTKRLRLDRYTQDRHLR